MKRCFIFLVVLGVACNTVAQRTLVGAPHFRSLIPFADRVEADEAKSYDLTDENGPWMVLATSFSGPGAERQARDLVMELRKEFNLKAYQHRRIFDFTEPVIGLGIDKFGEPRKMRHRQNVKFEEIAVLVGNFESANEKELQSLLQKVKHARPDCLNLKEHKQSTQRFAGLREFQRRISPDPEKHQRGPMGNAFVTRNPLLPDDYFVTPGLDPLVLDMNAGVEYSLLDCPGQFSVRVATFRGESTMDLTKMADTSGSPFHTDLFRSEPTKLELAADKAHQLTVALREQNIEAYEFHDRFESIVTIGSFDSVGTPREDGRIEINPAVHQIIKAYGPNQKQLGDQTGLQPRTLNRIPFDIQPVAVRVPKEQIRAALR